MGRKILAVIVALITAWGIILIVEMIASRLWSTPNNLEYMSRGDMAAYFSSLPVTAYVVVLVGYLIAAFFGGFIVTKMSRRESPGVTLPIVIGIVLTLGAILNFVTLPGQPIWVIVVGVLIFIPLSLTGHRFAR
jgi:hypothetical protein